MSPQRLRALHVEVGGSYGGSLRALEVYLAHTERSDIEHDVLFYYPTPGAERLSTLVSKVWSLHGARRAAGEGWKGRAKRGIRRLLGAAASSPGLAEAGDWVQTLREAVVARRLRRELAQGAYDVVHVNNTFTYQPATLLAARWAGIPVLSHSRNSVRNGSFGRRMIRLTAGVVTVSESLNKDLTSWGTGIPVHTCFDCVELPAPIEAVSSALRTSLLGSGDVLVGSVGRLDEQKGYDFFIEAARRVADVRPEVRFALAGVGPWRERLESLVSRLRLEGRFHLCGFRADVSNFIAALDLFVNSSLWEGLPIAIVEAMLLGKRVVATDVGGNPEVVIPGQTGTLVPPRDPATLATAILQALGPRGATGFDAPSARRRAAALTDPKANAQAFDRILLQVATSGAPSRKRSLLWDCP